MVYFVASGSSLPTGLNLDAFSGEISGTIAVGADTSSPYSVSVTAMDEVTGANATQTFNWTVNAVTVSLTNPGDQTNYDGDAVTLNLSASENASHSLTYSVTSGALPPGLSLDPSTGAITGTISSTADTGSPYSVTVDAADAITGTDDPQSFNWTVSAVTVSLTSPGDQTNNDADAVGFYLSATDSAGHTLIYTVDSTNALPPGLSLDPGSGRIYGVISATADTDSPYTVTVAATDAATGATDSQTFTWTVNPADPADGDTVTTTENQAYTFAASDFGIVSGDGNTAVQVVSLPTGGTLTDNGSAVTVDQQVSVSDITGGLLVYTPDHDAYGTGYDNFDFALVAGGCVGGDPEMVINVNAVNQKPSFTASNPPATNENLSVTIPGWATFNAGAPNESSQTATYIVTYVSNPGLFSAGPAIDASGTLTYTLATWANGTSTFDVQVQDSGGTADGGQDLSDASTYEIQVNNQATFMVNTTDDTVLAGWNTSGSPVDANGNTSLRAAIQAANEAPSGTPVSIKFSVGGTIYLEQSLGALPTLTGNALTIDGNYGGTDITVDAGGYSGIFYVSSGATATIDNLSLQNTANATAVINKGVLTANFLAINQAQDGSMVNFGTQTLNNPNISNSQRNGPGAGVRNYGTLTINDGTFINDKAVGARGSGGAVYSQAAGMTLTISGGSYLNNSAAGNGGAISVARGTAIIANATINGNQAGAGGGAISCGGSVTIGPGTMLWWNSANQGGGVYCTTGSTLRVNGASIGYSTATLSGGGIFFAGTTLDMTADADLWANNAGLNGGGIFMDGGTANLSNTFAVNNQAAGSGGAFYVGATATLTTVRGCGISGNTAQTGNGACVAANGTLNDNPNNNSWAASDDIVRN